MSLPTAARIEELKQRELLRLAGELHKQADALALKAKGLHGLARSVEELLEDSK